MFMLADLLLAQGNQIGDAIALQLKGMEVTENVGELNTRAGIARLQKTAKTLVEHDRCSEAELLLARALQALEQEAEGDSPATAMTAMLRGAVLQATGKLEQAEECFRRARTVYSARLGLRHQLTIGASLRLLEVELGRGAVGRATAESNFVISSARDSWEQATDPPSGFSLGSWSFSWNKSGPPKKDTDKLLSALQYAQALRLTASLKQQTLPDDEALSAAASCLEEAYLVIESSVHISRETKRQTWHDSVTGKQVLADRRERVSGVISMLSQLSRQELERLLLAEVSTVLLAIRLLLETSHRAAGGEAMQRLEEILELGA